MARAKRGLSTQGKAQIGVIMAGFRKGMGYSLRSFSEKMNTSHTNLAAIENGQSEVTRAILENFCRVTGFDLDVILASAGMIRFEYSDALRMSPNFFVTLFQLLSPENTTSAVVEELDYSIRKLRETHGVPTGKASLQEKTAIQLLEGIISHLQTAVLELKTEAGDQLRVQGTRQ